MSLHSCKGTIVLLGRNVTKFIQSRYHDSASYHSLSLRWLRCNKFTIIQLRKEWNFKTGFSGWNTVPLGMLLVIQRETRWSINSGMWERDLREKKIKLVAQEYLERILIRPISASYMWFWYQARLNLADLAQKKNTNI